MRHIFSQGGDAALAAAMQSNPLLAFEFDGTLAPTVLHPEKARIPLPIARRLCHLAERLPIAIVSGRRVDDVVCRLSFSPHCVIGCHGAELTSKRAVHSAGLDPVRARVGACQTSLEVAGVMVEDKGRSVAFHFRLARNPCAAVDTILNCLSVFGTEFRVHHGDRVIDVLESQHPLCQYDLLHLPLTDQ